MIEVPVEIVAKAGGVDSRGVGERRGDDLSCDETPAAEWDQLADGHAVAGDDEGLALIESAHDLTAVVAKFSLGDRFSQPTSVARMRRRSGLGSLGRLVEVPGFGMAHRFGCLCRVELRWVEGGWRPFEHGFVFGVGRVGERLE